MTRLVYYMARLFEDHLEDGWPWTQILFGGAVLMILLSRLYPNWGRE